jgi:hypothetical protein
MLWFATGCSREIENCDIRKALAVMPLFPPLLCRCFPAVIFAVPGHAYRYKTTRIQ